jgi:hypothetical protein
MARNAQLVPVFADRKVLMSLKNKRGAVSAAQD